MISLLSIGFHMKILRLYNLTSKSWLLTYAIIIDEKLFQIEHKEFFVGEGMGFYSHLNDYGVKWQEGETAFKELVFKLGIFNLNSKKYEDTFIGKPMKLNFGEFYHRIYRPYSFSLKPIHQNNFDINMLKTLVFQDSVFNPNDNRAILNAVNQLSILTDLLKQILDVIRPETRNLDSYGDKIKNLLVLACIEIESQWKSILKSNGYILNRNYSTKDYIKLNEVMLLKSYNVDLCHYPEVVTQSPYMDWNLKAGPTKSLKWYSNYNAVKHDSESEIQKANLRSAIEAVCAFAILIQAQYGPYPLSWKDKIGNFYDVEFHGLYDETELYFAPLINGDWKPIAFKFN